MPGVQAFPLICSVSLHAVDPLVPAYVVVDVEAANFTFDLCIDILDIHRGTQVFQFTDDADLWQRQKQKRI